MTQGVVDVDPIISLKAPLDEGPELFARLYGGDRDADEGDHSAVSAFDLTGKVAIVTGASRGLGQTFARALARAGADLVITSRNLDSLEPFQQEVESFGRRVVPLQLDVRSESSIRNMASEAAKAYPRLDILVNNAGCNVRKRAADVTWDDWNLILDTNLRGAFFVAQSVAAAMIPHGRGRIINIGSLTSVMGAAGLGPYGASRGGIRQLTMSLADDWGPHGITVNCLAPGWFKTDQNKVMYDDPEWVAALVDRIPVRRPGRPSDLEGPIVFLASDASEYITGQTLLVDGGMSTGAMRALPKA